MEVSSVRAHVITEGVVPQGQNLTAAFRLIKVDKAVSRAEYVLFFFYYRF